MPSEPKITILLGDEDALRRDGLVAVLAGAANYEIVAQVPDGPTAFREIRDRRPDVAILDLNLPGMHSIELVRRIRSEALPTRVVILASTTDDEIVREIVRAGADGYLLKSGPARHLIDAISYVRDGGQYFSPQLHRHGRERHLFEEPRREYPGPPPVADSSSSGTEDGGTGVGDERGAAGARAARPPSATRPSRPRPAFGRTSPRGHWRDRMKEEADAAGSAGRDYEIMTMMADGIRPILDRLDEIDNRVALMEVGDVPVPARPREWLTNEIADTLDRGRQSRTLPRTASEIEARLPQMIEEAVTSRFRDMAGKLQQQIEETHVRTLESFVKNIQVKLVQRVSALEQDMSKQAQAMEEMRESSQRTQENLSRLISGVDKLAQELPQRFAQAALQARAPAHATPDAEVFESAAPHPPAASPAPSVGPAKKRGRSGMTLKVLWGAIGTVVIVGTGIWGVSHFRSSRAAAVPEMTASVAPAASVSPVKAPPAGADAKTKVQAAQMYVDQKQYAMAEDLYKQVLESEPANVEALQGLASVLYREDKIDEAAAILDRIPK